MELEPDPEEEQQDAGIGDLVERLAAGESQRIQHEAGREEPDQRREPDRARSQAQGKRDAEHT